MATPSWPPADACEAVSAVNDYAAAAAGLSTAQDTPDPTAADTGKPVATPVVPQSANGYKPL